jgi:hypothetical protein
MKDFLYSKKAEDIMREELLKAETFINFQFYRIP